MKRLTRYFIEGLLFLGPVVATAYIVYIVFVKVDGIFKFQIPGLGFLVTLLIIFLIGFLTSNLLTNKITFLVDRMFMRLPLVKMVYTSLKDLINAFVGDKKGFNKPVAVTVVPGSNVSVVGFVTSEDLSSFGIKDKVAVYLPQSYNFAGNLLIVPREQITPLDADSGDLMAFIVSGGISHKHKTS
ncbi:hypothetical protein LCGC14_1439360 [marine sediment metagenome]|uniref:DUF502 domain-containing protein n=1 Tax=marine sediment metagenome TaxID=412755 RepID=A0A0F9MN26_9ZZZZ